MIVNLNLAQLNPKNWFGGKPAAAVATAASAVFPPVDFAATAAEASSSAKAVESDMASITFKSVGHFFAKAYKAVVAELPKVLATKGTVEAVTEKVPVYGPLAVSIEDAGYAVLGELSSVLNAGGAAAAAKLADAGLDINVIQTVQAIVAGSKDLATVASSLVPAKA